MKKLVSLLAFSCLMSSCALWPTQTVSRAELLTPGMYNVLDHREYTDMTYYGSDEEYDYFKRGNSRYRVARGENAIPNALRRPFDNWTTGVMYRKLLLEQGKSLLSNLRSAR